MVLHSKHRLQWGLAKDGNQHLGLGHGAQNKLKPSISETQDQHPKISWGKCRSCRRLSQEGEQLEAELRSHLSTAAQQCWGCSHAWGFLQPSLAPQIIPRQEKRQMEPQGTGKANTPTRRYPSPSAAGKHVCLVLS